MSFNRRGPDRRPDRRPDRPYDRSPRSSGPPGGGQGDWQRDRPRGDRPPYPPRGPRPDRNFDQGAMSIRLDPRRLGTLKQLAAEADMRPGDLVRQWVEERIDAARGAARPTAAPGTDRVLGLIAAIEARLAALEAAAGATAAAPAPEPIRQADAKQDVPAEPKPAPPSKRPAKHKRASAAPSAEHVALHDEMIAVLRERGPLSAADLAAAVAERGRYAPPRTKKPLDAAMVSQRVSNPTYRKLFTRAEGRIGLAE